MYPTRVVHDICRRALKEDVAEMTKDVDSVQFCLSKGLGAPVGSVIVGSREFIERCRPIRKMLGGGMRQAGVLAAAGLIALEQGPKRLQDDHDAARALAQRLARIHGIALDAAKVQTNIVIFSVKPSGLSSAEFLSRLAAQNVLAVPVDADRVRMVTHLDVSRGDIEDAADATERVLQFTSSTLYKEPASD